MPWMPAPVEWLSTREHEASGDMRAPVFMFSIQIASTGPSSTSHLRSGEGSDARDLRV
jgi:hypothetical protein